MNDRYFIDGYNLLHCDPTLMEIAHDDLEVARESLVESIAQWCAHTGGDACVFFDGAGLRTEHRPSDPGRPGVEVVFTSARLSADAVIERGVYQARRRSSVVVVTADHGIRDLCSGMGALTMMPQQFLSEMRAARPPSTTARPLDTGRSLGVLEDAMDDATRDHLKKLRDALDE